MLDWINQSRQLALANQAQRKTHILLVIILAPAILLASQFGAVPVVLFQIMGYGINPTTGMPGQPSENWLAGLFGMLTLVSAFGGIHVLVWLWTRFYEKRPFTSLGFELAPALWQYGRGFIVGLGLFLAATGIIFGAGFMRIESSDSPIYGISALGGVLLMLPGWLVQGAAEEVLTRGWMMPILSVRYRPWVGILVSTLFFSIMHGLNANITPLAFFNLALFALFAAFYALKEGSLWGVCAIHSAWNWIQGNILGLEVSGSVPSGGSLFHLVAQGPDWFTGGKFGPEGGLAVTIVLIAGIVILFSLKTPKNSE